MKGFFPGSYDVYHNQHMVYRICVTSHAQIQLTIYCLMTGKWSGGPLIAGAASLAVDQVDADSTLLAGSVLEYSWEDSGCSPRVAPRALGDLMSRRGESSIDALVGPGCSSACEVTSYTSSGYDIPQISFGCKSPVRALPLCTCPCPCLCRHLDLAVQ